MPFASFAECAPDDIRYLFRLANEDAQPHEAFLGQFTEMQLMSEKSEHTKEGWQATKYEYSTVFSGLRGNRLGFTERTSGKVEVKAIEVEGLSIPFFLPPVGEEAIFFFELTDEGWLIRAGGCGGLWVKTNNPKVIEDAIFCLANDSEC